MLGRKKGFTATQSKLTSHRMRSATIGTHVPQRARASRRGMNAEAVGFSNSRKKRRAARGIVDHVTPSTASGESSQDYSRRVSRRQFAEEIQRKARVRRIVAVVGVAFVVLCVAAGVGSLAFLGSVDGKLSLGDSNAPTALVAATDGEPYYLLCAASLGAAQGEAGPETDAYLLVRVDEGARAATVVSLPSNLQVKLSDGAAHPLYDVAALGGDAALVEAVAGFAGVNVSHFARTDAEGIAHLVDAVGGVLVNVAEEVDDPTAGDVYLAEGEQALDGAAALTLLRAQNYAGGVESQAANRAAFFFALANKLMEPHGLGMIMRLDQTASDVQTDWKTLDLMALADALRGLQTTYAASVPGHETSVDGTSQYVASGGDWTDLMDRVRAGDDPAAPEAAAPAVDPASFTVAVRNGTDVTGSAAQLTKTLEAQGFKVVETGNVDDYTVYPETLVIYHDEALSPAADAVVKAMGAGRAINGGSYYTFEADVLVIIGTDYQPIV